MLGTVNVDNTHKSLFLHVFCHCSFCRLGRASWQFRAAGTESAGFCAGGSPSESRRMQQAGGGKENGICIRLLPRGKCSFLGHGVRPDLRDLPMDRLKCRLLKCTRLPHGP